MCPRNERYTTPRNAVRTYRREAKKMVNGPYSCPKCCKNKLHITMDAQSKEVKALCLECGLTGILNYAPVFQPIDYYNKLVDQFKRGHKQ